MKKYQLICMSFDGETMKDSFGTLEECRHASENMGSKWYFYPWHLIVTEKGTIKEMYGGLVRMADGMCILGLMFNGRRLDTAKRVFRAMSERPENEGIDVLEFENTIITEYQHLRR